MADSLTLTERFARIVATNLSSGDPAMTAFAQDGVIILVYFIIAVLGAAMAEMFKAKRVGQSSVAFWSTHFPRRSERFHIRCDFVAKVFLGSVIAAVSTNIVAFLVRDPETIIGYGQKRKIPPECNRREVPVFEMLPSFLT